MSRRRAFHWAGALAIAVLAVARPAHAQSSFEHIEHFGVAMEVTSDGVLNVTETIDYDLGPAPKHGIYRYIPVRYHYDNKYDRVYPIDGIEVAASAGTPTNVKITDDQNNTAMRIGDPDKTITGRHQYVIQYHVRGALNHFDDHDELYWNATGNRWDVPISQVDVSLRFPAATTRLACFAGPEHSDLPCPSIEGQGTDVVSYHASELGPGSGLTVVAAIPPGVISGVEPVLEERWAVDRAFAMTPMTVGVAIALTALIAGVIGRMLWRHGRDRRLVAGGEELRPMFAKADGPVEYRPPGDLRPAQIGVLIDESADPLDVTASIVDLGVRGYLSIEEIPDKGLFSKGDWKLTKLKIVDDTLRPFEQRLLNALFASDDTVLLSDLKQHFYDDLKQIQDDLYEDSVTQKWFVRRPDRTRALWLVVGVLAAVVGIGAVVLVGAKTHAGFAVLPLAFVGILILLVHNKMPARTGTGTEALSHVLGFRRFITTAETERMQFAEEEGIFAKYLPYAIVFGATKQWAKRFEGLDASSPAMGGMGWYVSPYAFNPIGFSHSMHDFTVRTAGTIVATPPSASGSSGFGGFSGGGGGGGGGGSW